MLPKNLPMAKIKMQKERKTKKAKTKSCLFVNISQMILIKFMTLKLAK